MIFGLKWHAPSQRSGAVLLVVTMGLLLGWIAGGPSGADIAPTHRDHAWSLPPSSVVERYSAAVFQSIKSSTAWPPESVASGPGQVEGGAPGPSWSLVGIVMKPSPYALILQGSKVKRVPQGATLPDGNVVKQIASDAITLAIDGCQQTVKLFSLKKRSSRNSCSSMQNESESGSGGERHE